MNLLRRDSSWKRDTDTGAPNYLSGGDPLAIIYNEGLWRINHVTPLYNIKYQPVKLKMYAAKMRHGLVGAVQASSVKYKVTFQEQPNLRYSEEDASGLMVTVTTTQDNTNTKPKVVYSAILLSWGVSKSLNKAVHLPYMLERGEQKIGASVRATIQNLFDCNIRQYTFTQHQLLQFGFNFVDNDSSRSTDHFTLVYKTPQVEHKDKLSLSFDVGDVSIIWNGMKDEAHHPTELVRLTYQMLQSQIFHMIMLDITVFDVCEVNLAKAEIKSNGAVKMKTPEMVNCVFTVLNEITSIYDKDFSILNSVLDNENTDMEE